MAAITKVPEGESRENRIYNKYIKRPVNERSFLLEAGQGKNVNGNVFALLKYVRTCGEFDDWSVKLSLVPEKFGEADAKLAKYGIRGVEYVEFGGIEYRKALATSKYLITDNSFPAYFYKRPEQVYLNTWHGTPLKALGRTDIENAISIANVQANMAKADWLLHPNRFTKGIMMSDYMMERVFKHKTVVMDYPRNDALHKAEYRDEIIGRYGLEGKRLIAYMPTWRGTGRDADASEQIAETEEIIAGIQGMLREDEVLFVNLHFLIGDKIDYDSYEKVYRFPSEYETYDFLAACDVLITDYSSVSIDYASAGKEVILYLHDYEQYKRDKGFYLDVKELPFKKAYDMKELEVCLHSKRLEYKLDEKLVCSDRGNSAERIIRLITGGVTDESGSGDGHGAGIAAGYGIEDYATSGHDALVLAYFDNINRDESREEIRAIEARATEGDNDTVIMFGTGMRDETIETLKSIDKAVDFVRISAHLYCSNGEFRLLWLSRKTGLFGARVREIYEREARRQILQFRAKRLDVVQCIHTERRALLETSRRMLNNQ